MIEILALILFILRVAATGVLVTVLKTQWSLMKRPAKVFDGYADTDVIKFRRHLFFLTLALAGSNLLPIMFDLFIITDGIGVIWLTVSTLEFLVAYTISNAISALLAAWLIYKIYSDALAVDTTTEDSDHTLLNNVVGEQEVTSKEASNER